LASRREDGRTIAGTLTPAQAQAYAELMQAGRPLRAEELRSVRGMNHPEKLLEGARRVLDVRTSRYAWRATHLLRGDTPEAKRYWFRPPPSLRWALLQPVTSSG